MEHLEEFPAAKEEEVLPDIEGFLNQHRDLVIEIQELFQTQDYKSFLTLPDKLGELYSFCEDQIPGPRKGLPYQILEALVSPDHLRTQEEKYSSLYDEDGLYLPAERSGGGDFWLKQEGGASVGGTVNEGGAILFDMAGHGYEASITKAFTARLAELYHQHFPEGPGPQDANLCAVMDSFMQGCPFEIALVEYAEVKSSKSEDGSNLLHFERAGGAPVFVRSREKGQVQRITEGYPVLGYGFAANRTPIISELKTKEALDVFLASDGLSDIQMEDGRFADSFEEFCRQREGLSPEGFKKELFDFVKKAKKEGRAPDDTTVITISIL
ncbi:MAG: SpoIIE family protein phosphatase [Candidatus Harrisonbacteria bacterium]|nr:SpoIIE family protein phosphatase [Candidatus Harrisonbacteria bacterium]